jgi:sirohydrochlorin ferrochelatase
MIVCTGNRLCLFHAGHPLFASVVPASARWSDRISSAKLAGKPAATFLPALQNLYDEGYTQFVILPLFFGPSSTVSDFLPKQVAKVIRNGRRANGRWKSWCQWGFAPRVGYAGTLVDASRSDFNNIARILARNVHNAVKMNGIANPPAVVLVDHGSPEPAVGQIRNLVRDQLEVVLSGSVRLVVASSMERREGPEYAFNEPLLENVFDMPDLCSGDVVVVPLFLSAGRHAGEDGDIATILQNVRDRVGDSVRIHMGGLVGGAPSMVPPELVEALVGNASAGKAAIQMAHL